MIATKLKLECLIKEIRFAPDIDAELVRIVKEILGYVESDTLPEHVAAQYLVAAYQEYEIAKFFREGR